MVHAPDSSHLIAQNPVFAQKAENVTKRHHEADPATGAKARRGFPYISVQGVVRTVLALWCIKIAVATAQGPTGQAKIVAQLEEISPAAAALAAPDPMTRNAQSVRFKLSDWMRSVERAF